MGALGSLLSLSLLSDVEEGDAELVDEEEEDEEGEEEEEEGGCDDEVDFESDALLSSSSEVAAEVTGITCGGAGALAAKESTSSATSRSSTLKLTVSSSFPSGMASSPE